MDVEKEAVRLEASIRTDRDGAMVGFGATFDGHAVERARTLSGARMALSRKVRNETTQPPLLVR